MTFVLKDILPSIISVVSNLGYVIFIFGLIVNIPEIIYSGISMFSTGTFIALVFTPIESKASKYGLDLMLK